MFTSKIFKRGVLYSAHVLLFVPATGAIIASAGIYSLNIVGVVGLFFLGKKLITPIVSHFKS